MGQRHWQCVATVKFMHVACGRRAKQFAFCPPNDRRDTSVEQKIQLLRQVGSAHPAMAAIGQKQTSAFHFRAANSLYVLLSFQLACSALACIGTSLFACPCSDDGQILPQYRMRASPQYRRAAALPLFRRANSLLADYWSTSRKRRLSRS